MNRKKLRAMIGELCDERAFGGAYFVYLKTGYTLEGQHCFGEDSMRDVWNTMARVTPCDCAECKAGTTWKD